jgi:hypothetical protein
VAFPSAIHARNTTKQRTVPPKLHNRPVTLLTKDSTKATVSRVLTMTFRGVWGYTERAMETTGARTCIRKLLWTRCACLDPPPPHHHQQHRGKKSKEEKRQCGTTNPSVCLRVPAIDSRKPRKKSAVDRCRTKHAVLFSSGTSTTVAYVS